MKNQIPKYLGLVFLLMPLFSIGQIQLVTSGFNMAGGDAIENQSFDYSVGEVIANPIETNTIRGNAGILQIWPDNMTNVNIESRSQLSVYPNPSLGVFELSSLDDQNYTYRIYSTDGSLQEEGMYIGYSHKIDLSEYAPGVYLLNLSNENHSQNFKLLKL